MAASVKTSGSTTTDGTEQTLATVTDAGVYSLHIDLNAMVGGATPDIVEVRFYDKARSTDTERQVGETLQFVGGLVPKIWFSPPIISPHDYKVTLKRVQGTDRAYPWSIRTT